MGSIKINNILNDIRIEKVLGNLVLLDVAKVNVGKVGGNCSVKNAKGSSGLRKSSWLPGGGCCGIFYM